MGGGLSECIYKVVLFACIVKKEMSRNSHGFGMLLKDIRRLLRCLFSFPGFLSFVTTAAATVLEFQRFG